jgi:guanylate kinase
VDALLKREPNIRLSPSYTTRAPREGEKDGVDYFFVSRPKFEEMIAAGEFLEHADVYGNYYGTSRKWIERELAGDHDVLLEIDWQGAAQVRKLFPHMKGVFILPPSLEELRKRLKSRGKDSPETIERRMASAREDISHVLEFEYIIVNDRFDSALRDLKGVVSQIRATPYSRAQQAYRLAELLDEEGGKSSALLGVGFTEMGIGLAFERTREGFQIVWVQCLARPASTQTGADSRQEPQEGMGPEVDRAGPGGGREVGPGTVDPP